MKLRDVKKLSIRLLVAGVIIIAFYLYRFSNLKNERLTTKKDPEIQRTRFIEKTAFVKQSNSDSSETSDLFLETENNRKIPSNLDQPSWKCNMCALAVNKIFKAKKLSKSGILDFQSIFTTICKYMKVSKQICQAAIDVYEKYLIPTIEINKLSAKQTCTLIPKLMYCFVEDNPWNRVDWRVEMEKQNFGEYRKVQRNIQPNDEGQIKTPLKILHLSDIHVDLAYQPGAPTFCKEPLCCRSTSTPRDFTPVEFQTAKNMLKNYLNIDEKSNQKNFTNLLTKAGNWFSPHVRMCDIPLKFIESTFKYIKTHFSSKNEIDLIYFTGDIMAHNVWELKEDDQYRIMKIIVELMEKYFSGIPILYSIGNHDNVPANIFASDGSLNEYYQRVDQLFAKLILANDPTRHFNLEPTNNPGKGYFSQLLKFPSNKNKNQPNLRIISLNTNLCYTQNYALLNPKFLKDPADSLHFLQNQLYQAYQNNEKVHIIGHISPGNTPDCVKIWSRNYHQIIMPYLEGDDPVITGQFFGHKHYDEFQIVKDRSRTRPIGVLWTVPGLTTFEGGLPSFRIMQMSSINHSIQDMSTFTVNSEDIRDNNPKKEPTWTIHYKLSQFLDKHQIPKNTILKINTMPERLNYLLKSAKTNRTIYEDLYNLSKRRWIFEGQICVSYYCRREFLCRFLQSLSFESCDF